MRRALAICSGLLAASVALAQTPDNRLRPLNEELAPTRPAPKPSGVKPGQNLARVVFVGDAKNVGAPAAGKDTVDTTRVPWLADAQLAGLIGMQRGRPITESLIRYIVDQSQSSLQKRGKPFAAVFVPPQEVREGVLYVVALEGRIGRLAVKGAEHFSEESYLAQMRHRPGDVLDKATLDEDVAWLGKANPYRGAAAVLEPGAEPGQVDVELRAQERKPLAFSVGYDNTGSLTTGTKRLQAGVQWGNAFGLGHQFSYSLSASPDFRGSVGHAGSYVIPLPWRHILSFTANTATIKGKLPAPFDLRGESSGAGVRYSIPLADRGAYSHGLAFGVDYKRSDNNLLFSQTPVNNTVTSVYNLVAAYNGATPDALGQTNFSVSLTHSPGGVSDDNTDAAFNASRAFAKARFTILAATLDRLTNLPGGLSWLASLRAQQASGNLLGSEQIGLGGLGAVRGYRDGTGYGDEGFVLRNELRFGALKPSLLGEDQLTPFLFLDHARGRRIELLPGEERSTTLTSLGFGARYAGSGLSIRYEFGWQLSRSSPTAVKGSFGHFGISYAF